MQRVSHSDISYGIETTAVALDPSAPIAGVMDFVYVRHNIPGPGTRTTVFTEQFAGCESCASNCHGDADGCSCISRFGSTYDDAGRLGSVNAYGNEMSPVLECNKACKCTDSCSNRVVQKGVRHKLLIFKTDNKGFGVRCLENIPRNSFICEYAGEILIYLEARRRTKALKEEDDNYILVLREHVAEGEPITTYVDPTYIGNVGRFLNHSCDPNLFMVPVRVNNNIPRLALFALRDINSDEELTFDYSGVVQTRAMDDCVQNATDTINKIIRGNTISKDPNESLADPMKIRRKPCFCGAVECSGYLPFEPSLFVDDL